MALDFRLGDPAQPRGHALVFFATRDGQTLGTYLVVAPIAINLTRYMPPMFAAQMGGLPTQEITAMPLPPVPEEVEGGVPAIERLARLRGDDLLAGGEVDASQLDRLLLRAAELGQEYARAYRAWLDRTPEEIVAPTETALYDVDEVLRSLMGDHERISELAKLIGKLRYAVEGGDGPLADETLADMERIGRRLPEKYRFDDVLAAVRQPGERGARLAQLHVERCYKLAGEDYADVGRIDGEIKRLMETP